MVPEEDFTLGVEEEYLLVDPGSRQLVPASRTVLANGRPELGDQAVQHELYLAQVEAGTPVCRTLDEPDPAVAALADGRVGRQLRLPGRLRRAGGQPDPGRDDPGRHPHLVGRAARHGLAGELADVAAEQLVPAFLLVERFLAYLRPDLEQHKEWEEVWQLVGAVLARGPGAHRQRVAYARAGRFEDVIDQVVAETVAA